MFKNTKKDKTKLEQEIDAILDRMAELDVDDEEYETAIAHLSTLYKLQGEIPKWNISPDTMAVVVGNLFGILLILKYEDLNIITSKALGFVIKGRA